MAKTPKVKFKLGDRPQNFPSIDVEFKTNRGRVEAIAAVFKYRTREEYGEFLAEHLNTDQADFPRTESNQIDFAALAKQTTGHDADLLLDAIASWDLDDKLTIETLRQMASEQPAAVVALKGAYAAACNEGRLGN